MSEEEITSEYAELAEEAKEINVLAAKEEAGDIIVTPQEDEEDDDDAAPRQMDGWEMNKKHIFILSSSGKPIYSRYGDEQELVTTFGLLQAVVSIVQDAGDEIKCIKAGRRRIVYFIRHSLYFVSISSTGEPEVILKKQLEFMCTQILLVLTSKVYDLLKFNSSKDLRDLLGSDTTRLMSSACQSDLTPTCIAFESVSGFAMDKEHREQVHALMKDCVDRSGAALGLLLFEDSIISYNMNASTQLNLEVSDVLLLTHFVGNSNSLRSHDQNWVPICLPSFNDSAFLQAYISNLHLASGSKSINLSLVLIATSSEGDVFKELHDGRTRLEESLSSSTIANRIISARASQDSIIRKYLAPAMCLHFLYKIRPTNGLPSQCISTPFEFPMDTQESRDKIMNQYQRIGVCIRKGSSCPEDTLLNVNGLDEDPKPSLMATPPSSDHALAYTVLASGYVVVGLATFDSELYATFPGTVNVLESCGHANFLSKSLKFDAANLFQI